RHRKVRPRADTVARPSTHVFAFYPDPLVASLAALIKFSEHRLGRRAAKKAFHGSDLERLAIDFACPVERLHGLADLRIAMAEAGTKPRNKNMLRRHLLKKKCPVLHRGLFGRPQEFQYRPAAKVALG